MEDGAGTGAVGPKVRMRGILLPTEHGSWGFLAEPMLASLAVAWSGSGAWIALMVVGAFLSRQPLKIFLGDFSAGRTLPQTLVARRVAIVFFFVAGAGFAGTVLNGELRSLWPFALVAPLAAVQIHFDAQRQSRAFVAEIMGAVAMSSSAAAIALAGGLDVRYAVALWAVFGTRLVSSIVYVRNRLLAEKGKESSFLAPVATHVAAMGVVASLVCGGLAPRLALVASALLLARCAAGLSPLRKPTKAMKIGVFEILYGAATVLAVIVGTRLGI